MTTPENTTPSPADAARALHQLIELLFPDPIPDILTLRDFETRYQFTKLGELATQAIEKSQRINHRRGNYHQIGLCEFHVGLIYFFSNKYHAARQQFTLARQQWSFVYQPSADALAYFAEGIAHHFALQYESAMSQYNQAQQRLSRNKFAPPSQMQNDFVTRLSNLLNTYQALLQDKLWPQEKRPLTTSSEPISNLENKDPAQPGEPVPPQDTKPLSDKNSAGGTATLTTDSIHKDAENAPLPIATFLPIPGHKNENPDHYKWYIIEQHLEGSHVFPSSVQKGTYVLVDTSAKEASELAVTRSKKVSERMIILANGETAQKNGRITVKPVHNPSGYPRIFLGLLDANESLPIEGFTQLQAQTDNIPVTFSDELRQISIQIHAILGIVIGFWLPGDNPQTDSQEHS